MKSKFNPLTAVEQKAYLVGSYHYNWHPALELIWVLSGQVMVNVDGQKSSLKPDDLILVNSNQGHATFAQQVPSIVLRTQLDPQIYFANGLKVENGQFILNSSLFPRGLVYPQIRRLLAQLYLEGPQNQFRRTALTFELADYMYSNCYQEGHQDQSLTTTSQDEALQQATRFLADHYQKKITLTQIAQKCGYSTAYLSRRFKVQYQVGFHEYLTRLRLQHAIVSLKDDDLRILDVALQNGFNDVKAFNVAFKKHFGITPSEYRHQLTSKQADVDITFQSALSSTQSQAVKVHLKAILKEKQQSQLTCINCDFRQNADNYQKLKHQLSDLLSNYR